MSHGRYGSMRADPHVEETLLYLCDALSRCEVAYLHLVYQLQPRGNTQDSEFNGTHLSDDLVRKVREAFRGSLIWTGGFTGGTAQTALETGWVDLIGFGRPFIANPDLVARLQNGWPLAEPKGSTFYTRNGEKGYTDFPSFDPGSEANSPSGPYGRF